MHAAFGRYSRGHEEHAAARLFRLNVDLRVDDLKQEELLHFGLGGRKSGGFDVASLPTALVLRRALVSIVHAGRTLAIARRC